MYVHGCIPEFKFDEHDIPKDTNSNGDIAEKVEDISLEN